jgi:renalase
MVRALAGDLGAPLWANVQRWRYALPDSGCDGGTLNGSGSGLYFAGDFVAGLGRLHLALASGREVAARMLDEL